MEKTNIWLIMTVTWRHEMKVIHEDNFKYVGDTSINSVNEHIYYC